MFESWTDHLYEYFYINDPEILLIYACSYIGLCLFVSLCDSLFLHQSSSIFTYLYNTLSLFLGIPIYLLGYLPYCILLIVLVVTRQHGYAMIKYAWIVLIPFGKEIQNTRNDRLYSVQHEFMHFVWIFTGFLPLAILHCLVALIYGATLVGIPVAIKHWNLAMNAFWPFDKVVSNQHEKTQFE